MIGRKKGRKVLSFCELIEQSFDEANKLNERILKLRGFSPKYFSSLAQSDSNLSTFCSMVQVTWQFIINLLRLIALNSQKEKSLKRRDTRWVFWMTSSKRFVTDWEINSKMLSLRSEVGQTSVKFQHVGHEFMKKIIFMKYCYKFKRIFITFFRSFLHVWKKYLK